MFAPEMSTRVVLALVALYLIWGSTYFAMAIALQSLPPFVMAGIRFLVAGSGLYIVLRRRGAPAPSPAEWRAGALLGLFLLVGGNGLVAHGQQWASSSLAAIVVATVPLWTALFGRLQGQRSTQSERAGLVIGFAGVIVLNAGGELSALSPSALLLLLAPVSWAWGSARRSRLRTAPGAMGVATMMLTGGAIMLVLAFAKGERISALPSAASLAALAYLMVFGSLVGLIAYDHLLANVRPALATSYAYVNPVVAVALGVGLGGERLEPATLVALGVILAGVVLVTSGPYLERLMRRARPGRAPS